MEFNGGMRSSAGYSSSCGNTESSDEDQNHMEELRRGPWTIEEDLLLVNYIATHGEGRWNSLSHSAGLKRTGKSCRLRWLNYLRPDVRRGNITPQEQLLILELHSRWGNRWSKIAQYLPGRTDNEIKNYWRTRVQKHAKQLHCDVNSKLFKDSMKYIWMPRLAEQVLASDSSSSPTTTTTTPTHHLPSTPTTNNNNHPQHPTAGTSDQLGFPHVNDHQSSFKYDENSMNPLTSASSSDSSFWNQVVSPVSDLTDHYQNYPNYSLGTTSTTHPQTNYTSNNNYPEPLTSPCANYFNGSCSSYFQQGGSSTSNDHQEMMNINNNNNNNNNGWLSSSSDDDLCDNLFNPEDIWFLQQQLFK